MFRKTARKAKREKTTSPSKSNPEKWRLRGEKARKKKAGSVFMQSFVERRSRFCNAVVEKKVFTGTVCSRSEKKNTHAMQGLDLVIQKSRSEWGKSFRPGHAERKRKCKLFPSPFLSPVAREAVKKGLLHRLQLLYKEIQVRHDVRLLDLFQRGLLMMMMRVVASHNSSLFRSLQGSAFWRFVTAENVMGDAMNEWMLQYQEEKDSCVKRPAPDRFTSSKIFLPRIGQKGMSLSKLAGSSVVCQSVVKSWSHEKERDIMHARI